MFWQAFRAGNVVATFSENAAQLHDPDKDLKIRSEAAGKPCRAAVSRKHSELVRLEDGMLSNRNHRVRWCKTPCRHARHSKASYPEGVAGQQKLVDAGDFSVSTVTRNVNFPDFDPCFGQDQEKTFRDVLLPSRREWRSGGENLNRRSRTESERLLVNACAHVR